VNRIYYVYILASARNGTLYIGVTNDLARRAWEHKEGMVRGFTKKYDVHKLVYYELFEDINAAVYRETRPKKYSASGS
jgi:putative endonuclease